MYVVGDLAAELEGVFATQVGDVVYEINHMVRPYELRPALSQVTIEVNWKKENGESAKKGIRYARVDSIF